MVQRRRQFSFDERTANLRLVQQRPFIFIFIRCWSRNWVLFVRMAQCGKSALYFRG
jgi:hypothetical protein